MRSPATSTVRHARCASFVLLPLLTLFIGACAGAGTPDDADTLPKPVEEPVMEPVMEPVPEAVMTEAAAGAPATLNEGFRSADLDVADFLRRFEGESREVYAQREELVAALGLTPGQAVADIGSGTGLYSILFGHEVGPTGRVYGVDISSKFISYLEERAFTLGLEQVRPILCTDKSTKLKADSIDAAFICDTYHHFEYPHDTLASLHAALRPAGRLMIVDFERIPGLSRPWLMTHVRCGKEQVIAEIEAAGFRRLQDPAIPGLTDNYVLLFERP